LDRFARPVRCLAALLLTGALVVSLAGCGVKKPPVGPRQPPMQAVTDLAATWNQGMITLTWLHNDPSETVVGYQVYRSQTKIETTPCEECPIIFESAGKITVSRQSRTVRFELEASIGYFYRFKVKPYQATGAQGPDSNVVELIVQP